MNVRNMLEEKFRVHNVGSLGIERIINSYRNRAKNDANNDVLLTYHPETLENNFNWPKNFSKIIKALERYDFNVTITAPGHEKGSSKQVNYIKKIIKNKRKFKFIRSLGVDGYFEKLNKCLFVIGNSSSGIIEVPYFKIPTINIGLRQNGRFFHKSIIQSNSNLRDIDKSIQKATSKSFRNKIKDMKLYFGKGGSAKKILYIIKKNLKNKSKLLNKQLINNT